MVSTIPRLLVRSERYDGPSAEQLTEQVQQEYVARYGGPDTSPIDAADFVAPAGAFLIGYLAAEPVAMGGVRRHAGSTFELRRMLVRPDCRGRGLSRQLLAALEAAAVDLGAGRVVLETGDPQPEAVGLYRSSGYRTIEPFGYYADSPRSIHLAKDLGRAGQVSA